MTKPVRILLDGTPLDTPHSNRGIGRYTKILFEHLFPLLENDPCFEPKILRISRKREKSGPTRKLIRRFNSPSRFDLIQGFFLNRFSITRTRPALYHATDFLGIPSQGSFRILATAYDLAQFIYPEHYFHNKAYEWVYRQAYHRYRKCDLILAISESTRRDFSERLNIDPDRIRVTPLAADPIFQPKTISSSQPYFLCVGMSDFRKNIETAIESFIRAAPHMRENLLILNPPPESKLRNLVQNARKAGVLNRIDLRSKRTGDKELVTLYNGATALLFPSRYEGFGLPCLEAMNCGTPVICSTADAMIEVVGNTALTHPADDVDGFAQSMIQLSNNPGLRENLARKGRERSKKFSWKQTAEKTYHAYQEFIDRS